MLNLQEVAEFLTKEMNSINPNYVFEINAEFAQNNNNRSIKGILTSMTPKLPPVEGVTYVDYNFLVSLVVPTPGNNYYLTDVENIIGKFVNNWNGRLYNFTSGQGTVTCSLTNTGEFKTSSGQGDILPISFELNVSYSENVVMSSSKVWLLDDMIIPYTNENIILEKSGQTNMIYGREYNQTLLTNQTKYYHFVFPYTNSELCKMLQKDILQGSANKTYTLKYFDGISFTEKEPFVTTVSIFRNADTGSVKPLKSEFNLTFTDVDDGNNKTKYYFALIDWQFDIQTENTRYFQSQEEQKEYFDELIKTGADWEEIKAPNLNSIVLTSQYYKNTRDYDLFDLVNKNYGIIKTVKDNKVNYFYYYATNAKIGAENQIFYDLKLDSIQTYLFNPNIKFDGNLIQNAHINRFLKNPDGTYSFDYSKNSKLFEREQIREMSKRLTSFNKLEIKKLGSKNDGIIEFINKHVICWAYIITDMTNFKVINDKNFDIPETKTGGIELFSNLNNFFGYTVGTLVFPLLEDGYIIDLYDSSKKKTVHWGPYGITMFTLMNDKYAHIHSIKLSLKPPICISNNKILDGYNCEISDKVMTILGSCDENYGTFRLDNANLFDDNKFILTFESPGKDQYQGLLVYNLDYNDELVLTSDISLPQTRFKSDEIKNNKNNKLNPKLNGMDYKSLALSFNGSSFEIPIDKLNANALEFEYIENITPDNTKGLCRIKSKNKDNVFGVEYNNSYYGLLFTQDLSLPISNNQFDLYLANNKNAYLSFQNQQNYILKQQSLRESQMGTNMGATAINQALKLDFLGVVNTVANGTSGLLFDALSTSAQLSYEQTQFNLTMDNMKNSPEILQNANGNAIFSNSVRRFGIYVEIYEALESELNIANDIMYQNGFIYNQIGDVKDYLNIRKYFNYIKAIIGNISGVAISNEVRSDLRQRFSSGIRFWNTDVVDYQKENYENWLDE